MFIVIFLGALLIAAVVVWVLAFLASLIGIIARHNVTRIALVQLNFLAAISLVGLLIVDYSKGREWERSDFLLRVATDGLALNEREPNEHGQPMVDYFDDVVMKKLFRDVDGPPVKTQVEEVERVRGMVQAKIDESPNKATELTGILLPLARTRERREVLLRRLRNTKNTKFDDLQADLNGIFNDVLRETQSGTSEPRDPKERKEAIAWLLIGLTEYQACDRQSSWPAAAPPGQQGWSEAQAIAAEQKLRLRFDSNAYRRALTIVGLTAASQTMNEQASAQGDMLDIVNRDIGSDRSLFADAHNLWIEMLTLMALEVEEQQQFQKQQEGLAGDQQKVVYESRKKVKRITEQLLEAQRKTREQLDKQSKREAEVFEWQMFLRGVWKRTCGWNG